jgi:opacity protein-like surface antigen
MKGRTHSYFLGIIFLAFATLTLVPGTSAQTSSQSPSQSSSRPTQEPAGNWEISGQIGGQVNGGLDMSTAFFHRLEVKNGLSFGATVGYLLGEHSGVEFLWNRNRADAVGEIRGAGESPKLFTLTTNQYMANFLFHLTDKEHHFRPFVMAGLGGTNLSPDHSHIDGITRFAFLLGAGAKFYMTKHFGLRGQLKWSPTYVTTTGGGVWCDPIWGGCWNVGNSHYLHEFDASGGLTVRF